MSARTEAIMRCLVACLALVAITSCKTKVVHRTEGTDPRLRIQPPGLAPAPIM